MKEIFTISLDKYNLLIYEPDKTSWNEPDSYAWEVTMPDSDRPYKIWDWSTIEYESLNDALNDGVKAMANRLFKENQ